jgi:hypothetical protein
VRQELLDGAEQAGNLPVMFLDLSGQVLMPGENFTEPDEVRMMAMLPLLIATGFQRV